MPTFFGHLKKRFVTSQHMFRKYLEKMLRILIGNDSITLQKRVRIFETCDNFS